MTTPSETVGDYDLLFTSLSEAKTGLKNTDVGSTIQLQETARVAAEIEILRTLTEQVSVDSGTLRSLTLG